MHIIAIRGKDSCLKNKSLRIACDRLFPRRPELRDHMVSVVSVDMQAACLTTRKAKIHTNNSEDAACFYTENG